MGVAFAVLFPVMMLVYGPESALALVALAVEEEHRGTFAVQQRGHLFLRRTDEVLGAVTRLTQDALPRLQHCCRRIQLT